MTHFIDVDVFNRDICETPADFPLPWNVQYGDGRIIGFETEAEACAVQRAHRIVAGRDPMTGRLLATPIRPPCAVCGRVLEHVGEESNQPYGALTFSSRGHYGTAVFDPMDGSSLVINVCDLHVQQWIDQARTVEIPPKNGDHGWL